MTRKNKTKQSGFSLIELLIVIAIIAILASVIMPVVSIAREKAYYVRAKAEFKSIEAALEMYKSDHSGNYPADAGRGNSPDGLEQYLSSNEWSEGAWPGSILDWDVYTINPGSIVTRQISIRFCDNDICKFPNADWAAGFDEYSAVYYCIEGPCRPHPARDSDHPGRCVNCEN